MSYKRPKLNLQVTTLWDYPSQNYGRGSQGDQNYKGATPSHIIWNLLRRYTKRQDVVVDPCAGSGTTLDVAHDLGRRGMGFDVNPIRKDIQKCDSRSIPMKDGEADFVFIDPPYSTHIEYSDDPRCIGKLDAAGDEYYEAMEQVIGEIHRILKPGGHMALYVADSFVKGEGFIPIGFNLFAILQRHFEPVDIVSVVRHNRTLKMGNYRKAAEEGNFFLRGFNYLFIMHKPRKKQARPKHTPTLERRSSGGERQKQQKGKTPSGGGPRRSGGAAPRSGGGGNRRPRPGGKRGPGHGGKGRPGGKGKGKRGGKPGRGR